MLPRHLRLPREAFENTPGMRRAVSSHLSLSYLDGAEIGGCAVVVSKKVARLAVSRHLIKRRIKAVLKEWCIPGRIIVVHARSGIAPVPFAALKEELDALLRSVFAA